MSENQEYVRYNYLKELIKLIFRGVIPLAIIASGIALLTLHIPVWGLLIGLPFTIIGFVLTIYTYDEVVSSKINPTSVKVVSCSICGKPTPIFEGEDPARAVCFNCERERKTIKD